MRWLQLRFDLEFEFDTIFRQHKGVASASDVNVSLRDDVVGF